MKERLSQIRLDPEFAPGARNAVRVCLRIQPSEKVTVITDLACQEIAASIVHEIEAVGAPYSAFLLEDFGPRPMHDMPQQILDDMESSEVSVYTVQAQPNELRSEPAQDPARPHGQH